MIESEEAWAPALTKIRSPLEFTIALLRATGEKPKPQAIVGALNAMGQPFWNPAGPNGFPDTVDGWGSSEGLGTRIDLASLFAHGMHSHSEPNQFAAEILGPLLSPETKRAISRAETPAQGYSIALLSPEFQRR